MQQTKLKNMVNAAASIALLAPVLYVLLTTRVKPVDLDKKFYPSEWFYQQRSYPSGSLPQDAYLKAVEQKKAMLLQKQQSAGDWIYAGPDNIGGRITALAVDYTNRQTLYIGAAAGGIFKSTNGGQSWQEQAAWLPSLSIGALAIDPVNPDVLYCGTGEANISTESYAGIGILKTTNGGTSWFKCGLDSSRHIADIEIHPLNRNSVFTAVSGGLYSKGPHRGVYRSVNGGLSWSKVLYINDSTSAIDIALDPTDTSRVYAAVWERLRGPSFRKASGYGSRIYLSTDGGWNWSPLSNGLPMQSESTGRISIAVAPSNPNYVYALYQRADVPNGSTGYFSGFYRSTDKGNTWTEAVSSTIIPDYSNFGWYFGLLVVDPVNFKKIYAGGIDLFVTENMGNTWMNLTNAYSGTWDMQHPDQHALWIDKNNPSFMYCGNDGGFYVSSNAGINWVKRNNLPISQFYAATIDYLNPDNIYGGLQDNGTVGTQTGGTSDWREFLGGDGFVCKVDYTNSDIIYMEWQNGCISRSTDKGVNFESIYFSIDRSRTNWCSPFVLDPADPSNIYFGSYKLHQSTDKGTTWTPISPDLTRGRNGRLGTLTAVSVAIGNAGNRIFYTGTDDAKVSVSTDGGTSWEDRTQNLPQRYITDIIADQSNPATAYVTLSGYNLDSPMPHIYRTSNYGLTWSAISTHLPDVPVNSLIIDETRDSTLYAGTDAGVFYTTNLGKTWAVLGNGLPNSPVFDLVFHGPSRMLYAATHGRSMYKYDTQQLVSSATSGSSGKPLQFTIAQNYPNPFNNSTRIQFTLPESGMVSFALFNCAGQRIGTEISQVYGSGNNFHTIDARNCASGVYYCQIAYAGTSKVIKMLLLK